MKFTLKDYQDDAVFDALSNLRKARKRWHEEGDKHAFSLTATTGAGKTVMAAAVFEALFYGNDDFEFDPDPGAVVMWFSDDPSLNEQTRFRLMEASDRINHADLIVVQNKFNREKFDPGKIYFLNTQKLGKKSLLVRGHEPDQEQPELYPETRPDDRAYTIWDTIQNTIEDPNLTLYLILDEAHRGMGATSQAAADDRSTIVKRLINGAGSVPAIPIVMGISATVERFNTAMQGARGRSLLPDVVVDSIQVQASGLLKDTIVLDIPEHAGPFDTVLVRRATDKIKELSQAWATYTCEQDSADNVKPLLVLQVPNMPDHGEIGRALDTIFAYWPELTSDAIAHVFGDHTKQRFGGHEVQYISPERVQESDWIRVLIAKDAISTGWDCPRAEVMVSFRPAQDRTHITQLLGRMVRTPLARRIPGNERLNSVDCILPFFDQRSVKTVADALMRGGGGADDSELPGRRVLISPKQIFPNKDVPEEVWEKFETLPTQNLPKRIASPIKRLTALAHELAADELLESAGKKAHAEMHKAFEAAQARYKDELKDAKSAVMSVEGLSLRADLRGGGMSFDDFLEAADYAVIEAAYRRAARMFSADLARTYAEYIAERNRDVDTEDALLDAHADIAALGLVTEVQSYLESEAESLARSWLNKYRVQIKDLSDERQDVYRQISAMSLEAQDVELARPFFWLEPTSVRDADGAQSELPTFAHHLLSNDEGQYPCELNSWEFEVLEKEMRRAGFIAWYRNPSRACQESLGIVYGDEDVPKLLRPDFLIFSRQPDGAIVVDILDPHGTHFADALPKLGGLATFAEAHKGVFRRVEAIAKLGGTLRVLDLTNADVRVGVESATDAETLYGSNLATDY